MTNVATGRPWSMLACELSVPVPERGAGEVIHSEHYEIVFDAAIHRLTIRTKGHASELSWSTEEVQDIRWMAPKEKPLAGSPLLECVLDVALIDYRPGKGDGVVVAKGKPVKDDPNESALYEIAFNSQTDLVTVAARYEPRSPGDLATPELHWIIPRRHVRKMSPKPNK